ncbi:MAG: hypothetical protein Q8L02_01450 [Candidatus Nitrotoga sp.]|nr:hypothetical protein [Candidatus Nitrotoga sp.]
MMRVKNKGGWAGEGLAIISDKREGAPDANSRACELWGVDP